MFAQGTRLYAEGHYRDSVRPFETAAQFDADFALAWAALAKAYGRAAQPGNAGTVTGNPAIRASDAANHALALAPTIAESHLAAALAGRANRDLARWRSEARKAIAIDPRTAEAYLVLADSYNALIQYGCDRDQNPELADELYAKGLALEPSLPPDTRATNLRYLGRYNECIDLITQAQRKNPPAPAQSEVRGRCKLMLGDIDGAAQDITPLEHNRRTGTANSFIDLGWLNLRRGNTEEGVQQLELAADIQPNAQNELTIAYVYGDVSDPNHAVAHLRRAFALEPTCTTMVRTVIAFRQLRTFPAVQSLLTEPSFR